MPDVWRGIWVRDSLRGALIARLLTAFALIGVVTCSIAYKFGERYANLAYDRSLSDDVATLASQIQLRNREVQVNLPPAARIWLLANEGERVLYRVVDLRDGRLIEGNADLGPLPSNRQAQGSALFRDALIDGTRFRIGSIIQVLDPDDVNVLVEVGETLGRRQLVARQALAGSLLLFGLMIVVAVVLVWTSIDRTLKPLSQLEAEAATRSGSNLMPLDPVIAPREVRGLIQAINRMMKRVSDSIESQSRFVANAAHQLRTPIAGLRLQAQLAQDEIGTAETRSRLNEIDRSAARAAHVIEQLLTLSKSEAGSIPANFGAVDLTEVAAQVIQRHLPTAVEKDVDLGYSGLPGPMLVFGNETLLAELISNLVDNALRYGRRRGVVTVRIAHNDSAVVLEVIDDGPGIGALSLDTVFNRFQRGDVVADSGAGLGLAIVKEIAERHSATVSCDAPPTGGFRVVVAFSEIERHAAAMAPAATPAGVD
jgi:two-component system sensor histidine kinase TctE